MTQPAKFIGRLIDSLQRNRNKIAVIDMNGWRQTTYGELYDMSCRVAGYLRTKDLAPHSFICISLPTSREYIAAEIGIWLAGHAIVPMGDNYPQKRIEDIMKSCESPILINNSVMSEIRSTPPIPDITLPSEDDINSLFYTSGSTGIPKGVIHTFTTFGTPPVLEELIEKEDITIMGITAPMYFIACKLLYAILIKGGKANIIPSNIKKDIRKFENYIAEQQIEFVFIPPSVLPQFHSRSTALKVVLAAADRLSGVEPKGYKLINHYGQTETGGVIFSFHVDKAYDNTPIGRPDSHIEYTILDADGHEVPIGEEGELCVKGQFTPGYYKAPELTAELYKGGWLHTGDIVRQLPDGNILYVNRRDWMIKINGQRVEPGEAEEAIRKIEGIEDAVVKGFSAPDGRQFLCAYYVSPVKVSGKELRKQLKSKLPLYMVPSYFVQMDCIPRNANGKRDLLQLVSPISAERSFNRQAYEAPKNETEHKICKAFEIVLGIKRISINEDFFELGGDSVSVMRLQSQCPDLPLSAGIIFTKRTPRLIAEACQNNLITLLREETDYPLIQSQLGIYAACMSRQGEIAYNNGALFHLDKKIDLSRLAHACESIVAAHPYIKTRIFLDYDGNPRQQRRDDDVYHQSIETISDYEFEKLKPQLLQPFNVLKDQLFRIRIFQTPNDAYLFTDFHHIIFDGISAQILFSNLNAAYCGQPLQVEEWSAFEVARREELLRQTDIYAKSLEWNRKQFGNLDIVSIPMPDLHGDITTFGHQQLTCEFLHSELLYACTRLGVTPNVLTTAAFGYLLGILNYANEALFATIYNGRKSQKTAHTVGMMARTLAVHTHWDNNTTIREFLLESKNQLINSMSNDLYSFAELSAFNNHVNSHVLFTYQGDLFPVDSIGGVATTQIPLMENATGEQLAVEIIRNNEELTIRAEYHSNLYSEQFISHILHSYHQILTDFILEDLNETLSNINLVPAKEHSQLLNLGTGKQIDYNVSETFVDLFCRQAILHPDSIAVVDENCSITYSELDRKSDLLAAALIDAGVEHDTFVGIMLPRRKEFVIAMLAVFKAGGAYIPFDPDYPVARLDYMIEDSQTHLIVTESILADKLKDSNNSLSDVVFIDTFDFQANARPVNRSSASFLAYMIYTSGSTGKSKGVMIEHQGLRAMIEWMIPLEGLNPGERCAEFASFSFDASLLDLCTPLACGCEVHILPSSMLHEPDQIYDYFIRQKITGVCISTQMGMVLLNNYNLQLRYIVMGGEKLYETKKSSVTVINQYGPTEFTVCSAYHVVDPNKCNDNIPIGRPVPNSLSIVVSTANTLTPRGAIGELCLVGNQIARGYWNRPKLTSKKFIPCPFVPGKLMFHTGDLVRWNKNGELEFHGRIDNQVKLRGYRIELEEIESKLCAFKGVTSAAAVIHNINGMQSLAAYYSAETSIAPDEIRYFLEKQLPDYMVPQLLMQISKMPITPNGKIDRRKLTDRKIASSQQQVEAIAPETQSEIILFELAKKLLVTDQFGVTDDLTLYGLTSLAAIKFSMMAKEKGITIKVNDILRYKNIRDITSQKDTIGHWEGYSPEKPVVIFIQGMTSYNQLSPFLKLLRKHCAVYVIEPLEEHFHRLLIQDMLTNVKSLYVSLIKSALPEHAVIHAFVGHSMGGALAYHCAQGWYEKTGQEPKVCMFDTYCRATERKELLAMIQKQEMVPLLSEVSTFLPYPGDVFLFQATCQERNINGLPKKDISEEDFQKMVEANKDMWCRLVPQIQIYPIISGHFSMLTDSDTGLYLEKITS